MSKETERALQGLMKYLEKNSTEDATAEDIDRLVGEYMAQQGNLSVLNTMANSPESADDYLELAEKATSKKKKIECLTKALELEPDHLDAAICMASVLCKNKMEYLDALRPLIEKGNRLMTDGGYFKNNAGDFWMVFETRPYMRLRFEYFTALIECGMMRSAATEGKEMLKLCENDNLGVRYQLMHIYAFLEDEAAAKRLFKKYGELNESSLLLPMAVLYYKLNKLDTSVEYLQQLNRTNKDTKKFFSAVVKQNLETFADELSPYGYRPFTVDELLYAFVENEFLYATVPEFFSWAGSKIKTPRSGQKKA